MIYESTFSDILGIVLFYSLLSFLGPDSKSEIYGEVFGNLIFTIVFSIIISYILIYFFQNIKGQIRTISFNFYPSSFVCCR